jgi:hypothetical protein
MRSIPLTTKHQSPKVSRHEIQSICHEALSPEGAEQESPGCKPWDWSLYISRGEAAKELSLG